MSLTELFLDAFSDSYREAKGAFDPVSWQEVWKCHWSRFMLWDPPPAGVTSFL